jgi:hypothetical protein
MRRTGLVAVAVIGVAVLAGTAGYGAGGPQDAGEQGGRQQP